MRSVALVNAGRQDGSDLQDRPTPGPPFLAMLSSVDGAEPSRSNDAPTSRRVSARKPRPGTTRSELLNADIESGRGVWPTSRSANRRRGKDTAQPVALTSSLFRESHAGATLGNRAMGSVCRDASRVVNVPMPTNPDHDLGAEVHHSATVTVWPMLPKIGLTPPRDQPFPAGGQ